MVTGITGQDGSFLAELLLERGYEVIGMVRGPAAEPLGSSEHLRGRLRLVPGDLLDPDSLSAAVAGAQADELYHLAAPSFVPESWRRPARTLAAIAGSTASLLEAVREHSGHTRVFVAGSGAMFGAAPESPQREDTPCRPETPYASAKLAAHQLVGQLRANDDLFACSGILYNHESERRPESFVTRKVTRAAAAIKLGQADHVVLGDLGATRDWSFAGDMMLAAWLMLQRDEAEDYILASGAGHTVAEFVERAFAYLGLRAEDHVRVEAGLRRAPEPTPRVGDPSRARDRLKWRPTVSFEQLIERMVDADLRALELSSAER
ncbi:MAG: GDP-mannose 4,6-dehydratase [Solirubrobacterales bacterium]|nr:GDP-mannose 4,6-dehydratase [Solirubrobacterales bacterium]